MTYNRKKYHAEYYQKNKERLSKQNREWALKNKEKTKLLATTSYHKRKSDPKNIISFILKNAKARAKQKGIEFSLIPEDIELPKYCPILKVPLSKDNRRYGYSLDRKDPTKGYTKDNIWIISQIANAMKWDSTPEERIAFAKWVLSLEGGNLT